MKVVKLHLQPTELSLGAFAILRMQVQKPLPKCTPIILQARLCLISHVLSGIMAFCKVAAVSMHVLVSWLLQMTLQLNK